MMLPLMSYVLLVIFIKLHASSALTTGSFTQGSRKATLQEVSSVSDCFMFIGYDEANDTILLMGSAYSAAPSRFVTFQNDVFTEHTQSPISISSTYIHCGNQRSTQIHHNLWMMDNDGEKLIKFDTKSYTADYSASLSSTSLHFGRDCMTSTENYIFLIGNINNNPSIKDYLKIYVIGSNEWLLNLPHLQNERHLMSCAVVQNTLYVIGGEHNDAVARATYRYDNIEMIDISSLPSTNLPSWAYFSGVLSEPLIGTYAVTHGTDIIVIGGSAMNDGVRTITTYIHVIDTIAASCILQSNPLAFATYFSLAVITGRTLYVFSGGHVDNEKKDGGSYQYVTLPSLQPTTVSPTSYPTAAPIREPTTQPTSAPTVYPTTSTISVSTLYPSSDPIVTALTTENPSFTPTNNPSFIPTNYPSFIATNNPNLTPYSSVYQTKAPIFLPTLYPTYVPSKEQIHSTVIETVVLSQAPSDDGITDVHTATYNEDIDANEYDEMDISSDLLSGLPIMLGSCCACILSVCVVYQIWSRQQQITVAAMNSMNIQSNLSSGVVAPGVLIPGEDAIIVDDKNGRSDKKVVKPKKWRRKQNDSEMMKLWLRNVIHLAQYYDVFVEKGYESLESVQEIQDEDELIVLGINNVVHRVKIMHGIKKLKTVVNEQCGEDSKSEFVEDNHIEIDLPQRNSNVLMKSGKLTFEGSAENSLNDIYMNEEDGNHRMHNEQDDHFGVMFETTKYDEKNKDDPPNASDLKHN